MHVEVVKIDQSFNLANGEMENFLVLKFPNKLVRAKVDEETVQDVLSTVMNGSPQEPVGALSGPLVDTDSALAQELLRPTSAPEEDVEYINWRELPEDELSPLMKNVLNDMNIPDVVPRAQLSTLIEQVIDYAQQQAQDESLPQADAVGQMQPQQPIPQPPQQPVGRVQFGGRVVNMGGAPDPRSVPSDSKGNPVVPNAGSDPGEIGVSYDDADADEDGVPSL